MRWQPEQGLESPNWQQTLRRHHIQDHHRKNHYVLALYSLPSQRYSGEDHCHWHHIFEQELHYLQNLLQEIYPQYLQRTQMVHDAPYQ